MGVTLLVSKVGCAATEFRMRLYCILYYIMNYMYYILYYIILYYIVKQAVRSAAPQH